MNFFGRKNYLDTLTKRVRDLKDGYRQNIAVIGDEFVGKTSIIFKLLNDFCDNRIVMLYVEARAEPFALFAKRFIGVLLYNFLANSGMGLKEDLDFLIRKSQGHIPKTTEKIRHILALIEARKKSSVFTELLSLCEIFNRETEKHCVVILDEFHNLENMGIKNMYREWSRLLITQKNTMYIITSSKKFKARAILSKNLSLLFGNFELITVEPFDIKTSDGYLNEKFKQIELDSGLKDFIVNFTGGYPFYLEVIASEILKGSGRDNLADIMEGLLFNPSGILHQRFSGYLKYFLSSSHSNDYISILHLVSGGQNKVKYIAGAMHKGQKELLGRINHLLETDAVNRSGDFLTVNDRVFGFWLKFVHQEKLNSLTYDAKNQRAIFRENIENMVGEFLAQAKRPMPQRITEVLHLLEDEVIQIEKKRMHFDRFKEIKPLEFLGTNMKEGLICRSNDSLWIMAFKYDMLTEDDITGFVKECRKYRHKLQKKIIIALNDIDTNARLRALEEKILTWNITQVNQIFDLFSKPRLITK